jgi:glycosyltransferase involved in cell wall biosynthesis
VIENKNSDEQVSVSAEELNHRYWQERLERCQLQQEVARLKDSLDQMQNSKSWKITAPLRAVARWISPETLVTKKKGLIEQPTEFWQSIQLQKRALYVDVSSIAATDYRGGIEHVVRGMLGAILTEPWSGYEIIPVRYAGEQGYVSANNFLFDFSGLSSPLGEGIKIIPKLNDVFLGLDYLRSVDDHFAKNLEAFRNVGSKIYFFVYDLLPLTMTENFPAEIVSSNKKWLDIVVEKSDALFFISKHALDSFCENSINALACKAELCVVPMGVNKYWLEQTNERSMIPAKAETVVLMVGTVEPRKQHLLAVEVFEQLWKKGVDAELRIVGRKGWQSDRAVQVIRQAVADGKKITWLENATDAEVRAEYRSASTLLNLSLAEGYGLPLIEAAAFGLPLILNDIPVFREIAKSSSDYVSSKDSRHLAEQLGQIFLKLRSAKKDLERIKVDDWLDCANFLRIKIEALCPQS